MLINADAERVLWDKKSQELDVEQMYTKNAYRHTDVHGRFLNFGLWENGCTEYLAAAENMVRRLAIMLELRSGHRLLDVACGWGAQDFYLQKAFGPLSIDAPRLGHEPSVRRIHFRPGSLH